MDFGIKMCYASTGISLNILKDRIRAQKCCIHTNEIDVDKFDVSDLEALNEKLSQNIKPTSNAICNGLKECVKLPIKNLTVNASGCNIKCYMCPCSNPPDAETKETYFKTLYKLKDFNLDWLYLSTGGEPFIWKKETLDYIDVLDESYTKHLDITSNGTLINSDDISRLSKAKIDVKIAISISDINAEGYENIHCNKNFEKVLENTLSLHKVGLLRNVNVVICKYNIDNLDNILKFWQEKGIAVTFMTVRNEENIEEFEQFKLFKKKWPNYDLIKPTDLPTPLIS